jgi:methionine-rich copper-binding protein CopC
MKLLRATTIIAMLLFVLLTSCKKDAAVISSDPSLETSTDLLKNKPGDVKGTKGPTSPADGETGVPLNQVITVNFNENISPEQISKTAIVLKQDKKDGDEGDDDDMKSEPESVLGTLSYTETSASFTPDKNLDPNTRYKATVKTKSHDKHGEDHEKKGYDWHFTTGAGVVASAPSVSLTDPANKATGVAFNKAITVTFSEAMDPLTISTSTFMLKQGLTSVSGSISYTGNKAIFTPASDLAPNQVYTGTITVGAKNMAGVALLSDYIFSFTTGTAADITAPVILSTNPANSAVNVAANATIGITFSEAMNASTISTSTITLKQGAATIAGTVSYTGNTATFTPSNIFIAGTIYSVTITTGAKDLAGNALAANYVFNFTTVAVVVVPGLSFATDVMPVLGLCQNCHTHGWTPSTVASTYYTNLVNAGYVTPSAYTSSKIYTKLSGGHPGTNNISATETNKILNWMKEGSKNN